MTTPPAPAKPVTSAYDVYIFYLDPEDLKGQSHTVKITDCRLEKVFDPLLKTRVPRIVLEFENRKKRMALNKTQAGAMIGITGTDDFSKWVGAEIILTPAPASNGRQTIAITTKAAGKDIT